jgi:hypothetical protein
MARIESHAAIPNRLAGKSDLLELSRHRQSLGISTLSVKGMRVGTGMNLTDLGSDPSSRLDLPGVCVDKHTGHDASLGEFANGSTNPFTTSCQLSCDIQATLSRYLMAALRHEHRHLGLEGARNPNHLVSSGHLEIELNVREVAQTAHILILNMAAILAQMDGNAVSATEMGLDRSPNGIGLIGSSSLPHRRDVIDIDTEFNHGNPDSS